ncbi:1-(5-phosphoribosyl)-5-[(5-phosphoribosylamino)methylideneamino]imidazole-4-carboxamide isomerase [Halanaerobium sp. MA284_MarDTE_T2]|uniref:1-(5-phosphoribosyl)-5-[(5- phosphoribosylamino)methylideneamino]imidazole-4- carboxamide isomerase n=1 Tax=Halanaerobium sp. MA284_MarDTE_T2 TaxID=2183913 RepID=UPI000DF387F5|nr:1-(5-phosphoribosyl)-5-[(5-phosphoribosylamino)methylideneamino]imidazole-4-carboxamide isomerase [Halanaerobium sp. MA284_MarDTE_T2]RCW50786.1 1-(5-phosphoribosyl)-5-[(5-phosphoribosylamino)methylideneamino] imidazole-4-carboxamide isomerase [Halanaerobium sp. MA284_MarDTE_T2]
MIILPAVDLQNGEVVRLKQGNFDRKTVYSSSPVKTAKMFACRGTEWIHIVDLDGACAGESKNLNVIRDISEKTELKIQAGGGVRSKEDVKRLLELGVDRVIIGTLAVKNLELLQEIIALFGGENILVSIDARGGKVASSGWLEDSKIDMLDFAVQMESLGVKYILYTDISRDGMLAGPDFEGLKKIKSRTELNIIASGGISSERDLIKLAEYGFYGAITGQAVYQGKIDLKKIFAEIGDINA